METDTDFSVLFINFIIVNPLNTNIIIGLIILFLFLIISGLISASEIAFFSLNPKTLIPANDEHSKIDKLIIRHLSNPERLLATILIANNFVNISIVIFTTYFSSNLFNFTSPLFKFIFEAVTITFIIIFFCEIIPKVYANYYNKSVAHLMAYPLLILEKICKPFSQILLNSTSIVNKRIRKKLSFSIEKLSEAINYASESINQDVDILHGIVKFGNTDVKEIMTPRLDVVSVDITSNFMELKNIINESGYSRIPVYESTFDSIRGILYIKDLVKHINDNDLKWSNLIREPYFVPETKKIDDLLQEFQQKKIHMAIVSDEYGGIIGIITLEDILEEIIGEIKDEFDIEENNFKKIDDFTYIFEGKTQLNNFYKILETDEDVFDDLKGDSETLAGLILELRGNFPVKGEIINCHNFSFQIESVDNRKINTIKVTKKIKKPE